MRFGLRDHHEYSNRQSRHGSIALTVALPQPRTHGVLLQHAHLALQYTSDMFAADSSRRSVEDVLFAEIDSGERFGEAGPMYTKCHSP